MAEGSQGVPGSPLEALSLHPPAATSRLWARRRRAVDGNKRRLSEPPRPALYPWGNHGRGRRSTAAGPAGKNPTPEKT